MNLLARPDVDTGATRAVNLLVIARTLADMLSCSQPVTRRNRTRLMMEIFGASDADGAWSLRDACDALETAQVLLLGRENRPRLKDEDQQATFAAILELQKGLPAQSSALELEAKRDWSRSAACPPMSRIWPPSPWAQQSRCLQASSLPPVPH